LNSLTITVRLLTPLRDIIVCLVFVALVAGCGQAGPRRPNEARGAAVHFLRALQDKRFAAACASVSPDLSSDLRVTVLGTVRPTGTTLAAREREVQAAHRRAATCPGVMAMLREQLGGELNAIVSRASRSHATWLGPDHHDVVLDDEAWDLSWHDGTWRIDVGNALADGVEAATS
jgi:hypothetical protein